MGLNINKPAPRWFRITKKILSNLINLTMGVLLLLGYGDSSLVLLIIKLGQSFLMDTLDTFLSNGEVYAREDTVTATATFTKTAAPGDAQLNP